MTHPIATQSRRFKDFIHNLLSKSMVQQALNHFCEQYSVNGNLVLLAIWYGREQHGRLRKKQIQQLHDKVYAWHEKICKAFIELQETFTQNKAINSPELLEKVENSLQLAVEIEQNLLMDTLKGTNKHIRHPVQQLADASNNLTNYFKFQKIQLNDDDQHTLNIILQAVFAEVSVIELSANIEQMIVDSANNQVGYTQLVFEEV